jgi:hypothetical protein
LEDTILEKDTIHEPVRKTQPLKEDSNLYPSISLLVDNRLCAPPDGRVAWGWRVQPEDASVEINISEDETQLFCLRNQPSQGTFDWIVPRTINQPTELTITVIAEASGKVAKERLPLLIDVEPKLKITGIEITQGIQTFDRTNGPPDNSLEVVGYKDTIVRVYLSADRNGFNNDLVPDVTGVLEFDGIALSPINGQVPDNCGSWTAGNPFVTARPAAQVDRAETDHTLNFRIPASLATPGNHVLAVRVTSPEICGEPLGTFREILWQWKSANALPIRYLRIEDNHPTTGTNSLPTIQEAACTISRAFDLIPSPATDVGEAKITIVKTQFDLTTSAGLIQLGEHLADARQECSFWEWLGIGNCSQYDSGAIWIGLHKSYFAGVGKTCGDISISPIYDPQADAGQRRGRVIAAHEIGHNLCFEHVGKSCLFLGLPFPQNANYCPANNGLLWDVPFDPFWNEAIPGSVGDFMSHACRAWTSGDSWNTMRQEIG